MTQIVPTVPVTVPVTVPGLPFTTADYARLAREVGIAMRDLDEILASFNISPAAYEKIKANEWYSKLVDEYRIEWNSTTNTTMRTQLKSLYAAEEALAHVYARCVNGKEPLNHVVEGVKWMTDVAGLKKTPNQGSQNDRFQITINLGADTKIEFDGSRAPIDGAGTSAPLALPLIDDKEERV
jgi:hypothetical protein